MNLKNQVKFGNGQPTDRGGRPKKQPFVEIIEEWLQNEGVVEFEPKNVQLLPNGNYQVQMSNQQILANKFLEMIMKGDARFMEMYFKLFGEYQAVKHDVAINENPFKGKDLDKLSEKDKQILLSLGEKV
jgi:hypothetical protein